MRTSAAITIMGLVGTLASSAFTPSARGETAQESAAEGYVKRGVALRRDGNDVAALREFQKAWDLLKTPRTSAQLGLCQQALGQWAPAQARLLEALAAKGDPWIERNRVALENALASARQHIGHIAIVGDPKGAEVLVGGRLVGTFPLGDPIAVSEGAVDVEVRAPTFQTATRTVKIDAGQFLDLVFRLKPQGTEAITANEAKNVYAADGRQVKHDDLGLNTPRPPDSTDSSTSFYERPWFWVAAGAVVASVILVTVLSSGGGTAYPRADKTGDGF